MWGSIFQRTLQNSKKQSGGTSIFEGVTPASRPWEQNLQKTYWKERGRV